MSKLSIFRLSLVKTLSNWLVQRGTMTTTMLITIAKNGEAKEEDKDKGVEVEKQHTNADNNEEYEDYEDKGEEKW